MGQRHSEGMQGKEEERREEKRRVEGRRKGRGKEGAGEKREREGQTSTYPPQDCLA